MIIRLFIFNTSTWGLKYINLPIQIEPRSIKLENNLWPGFLEQIKTPEILILADHQ